MSFEQQNDSLLSAELVNFSVVSMLTSLKTSARAFHNFPWSYNVSQQHVYFLSDDQLQVYDRVQVPSAKWQRHQLVIVNFTFDQLMLNVP